MTVPAKKNEVTTVGAGGQPPSDAGSLMAVITRAASDPNIDITKLERLMAMHERITAASAKGAYTEALAQMQPKLPIITERGKIEIGKGKPQTYARWDDINEAIKPVLTEHGFALTFRTGRDGDRVTVTGILSHHHGHSEETTMYLPLDTSGSKNNVQAYGSSLSYGQRYTAKALLNLTSRGEDDDGKAAGNGGALSQEQIETLQTLIVQVGADIPKFCKYMGVARIEEIPTKKFKDAVSALEQKRKAS